MNTRLPEENHISFHICHANLVVESYDVGIAPRRSERYDRDDEDEDEDEDEYEDEYEDDDDCFEEYLWEENQRNVEIAEWYDTRGKKVMNSANLEIGDFNEIYNLGGKSDSDIADEIMDDEKLWGDYEDEDIDGYTGNEGLTKTTTYSKYLLVVWPKSFEFERMLMCDTKGVIESMHKEFVSAASQNEFTISDQKYEQFEKLVKHLASLGPLKADSLVFKLLNMMRMLKTFNLTRERHENVFDLVKKFLTSCKPSLTVKNCSEFVMLVTDFDANESLLKIVESLVEASPETIIINCHFISVLSDSEYFNLIVVYLN